MPVCNRAISLAWVKLFQLNQEGQYSGIFESLAVIGWSSKDLYPVSSYMNKEREEKLRTFAICVMQYMII